MHHETHASGLLTALCEAELRFSLCSVLQWSDDGPPEWIHLLPVGPAVVGRDGRSWRLPDPETIVSAFTAGGMPIVLDWEHATELKAPKGERADAAGFITELSLVRDEGAGRAPGIWGRVEWTPDGATSVRSKAYRWISPVFLHDTDGVIKRLISAALTNRPNLDLFALNHQRSAGSKENDVNEEQLKRLRARLGLAADASAEAVETALNARIDTATRATNLDLVPKTDLDAALNRANVAEGELKKLRDEGHEKAVNAFIEKGKAEGKIAPASEPFYRSLCATAEGLANTQKHYETLPVIVSPEAQAKPAAQGGSGTNEIALTAEEKARCQRLGIDEKVALNVKREEAARGY